MVGSVRGGCSVGDRLPPRLKNGESRRGERRVAGRPYNIGGGERLLSDVRRGMVIFLSYIQQNIA